jgi:hypothetical protein
MRETRENANYTFSKLDYRYLGSQCREPKFKARAMKPNAEIGLSEHHSAGRRLRPKTEFKAREAYSLYAAAHAR